MDLLCNELFSAALVEVMNSDNPSTRCQLYLVAILDFEVDSKKDFLKMILLNKISFKFSYGIKVCVSKKLCAKFGYS